LFFSLAGPVFYRGNAMNVNAPTELMFLPAGEHTIKCEAVARSGRKFQHTVSGVVTAEGAQRYDRYLQNLRIECHRNPKLPTPHLDFGHQFQEPTFYALGFRWGGDDPERGGIRIYGYWSELGRRLLATGVPLYVSPVMRLNLNSGFYDIEGYNLGGITPRPAFKANAPILSPEYAQTLRARNEANDEDAPMALRGGFSNALNLGGRARE
jgi:hypothetical protein